MLKLWKLTATSFKMPSSNFNLKCSTVTFKVSMVTRSLNGVLKILDAAKDQRVCILFRTRQRLCDFQQVVDVVYSSSSCGAVWFLLCSRCISWSWWLKKNSLLSNGRNTARFIRMQLCDPIPNVQSGTEATKSGRGNMQQPSVNTHGFSLDIYQQKSTIGTDVECVRNKRSGLEGDSWWAAERERWCPAVLPALDHLYITLL